MANRNNPISEEQRRFIERLEQASAIVRSWPRWKQEVLESPQKGRILGDQQHANGEPNKGEPNKGDILL